MENLKAFVFIGALLFSAAFIALNGAVMINGKVEQEAAARGASAGRLNRNPILVSRWPGSTEEYSLCELGTFCSFTGTAGQNVNGLCRNTEEGLRCVANLRR